MKINSILILILIFSYRISFSQGQANNWYFGNKAALNFSFGAPEVLFDSQMFSERGNSTMSDANGNLLFYTNGEKIWNRNNELMIFDGDLLGSELSTQASLIVPYPGNTDLYYIFTTDENGGGNGLRYSLVDMRLESGLGNVILDKKNILLEAANTEKLTAVLHGNGVDIWLISHRSNTNEFTSYLLTQSGIEEQPIVSAIGFTPSLSGDNSGYLKSSPDGSKVGIIYSESEVLELFEFNTTTGKLTNPISFNDFPSENEFSKIYGLEFSPDNKLLYVSELIDGIFQFNIENFNKADIQSSKKLLIQTDNLNGLNHTALQLGPDDKIYVAHENFSFIGVINKPNIESATESEYVFEGVSLAPNFCFRGLPSFVQSFFSFTIEANDTCLGATTEFKITKSQNIDTFEWDFGDGIGFSTDQSPSYTFQNSGLYTVSAEITSGSNTIRLTKEINVFETPVLKAQETLRQCDDDTDGFSSFNLNEVNDKLTQNPSSLNFSFYESEEEAIEGKNTITNSTAYVNKTVISDQVWVRAENTNGCFDTAQINLIVSTTQIPSSFSLEYSSCDDGTEITDGIASFDLSSADISVRALFPSGQQLSINYYRNQEDALAENNPIIDLTNYQNIGYPNNQEIYIRVDDETNNDCIGLGNYITLSVLEQSIANDVVIDICDVNNDAVENFILSDYDSQVLGNQDPLTFEVLYFESILDAENGNNVVPNNYQNKSLNQILYARVQNINSNQCYSISTLELNLYYFPIANQPPNLNVCDDDSNDQKEFFNLANQNNTILNGQSNVNNTITYHLSYLDAENNENPIDTNYENITNPQTIYTRIENNSKQSCFSITSFDIEVFKTPKVSLTENVVICGGIETSIGPITNEFDTYLWASGETTPNIVVSQEGVYELKVSYNYGVVSCEKTIQYTVIESSIAELVNVNVQDFSSNNFIEIKIEGDGDYEFSIDGLNYQNSNIFDRLTESEYIVYIRDKNGCDTATQKVYLLDYPKFFSPNGDGINDYWQITNSDKEDLQEILIYNRYGKLLFKVSPNSQGWNGTYDNKPLPENSYWFKVVRSDGRVLRGNFSLVR